MTRGPLRHPRRLLGAVALSLAATLLGAAARAGAQEPEGDGAVRIGIRAAAFLPGDAEVRRAFGDVIPVLGVAAAPAVRPGVTQIYPSIELVGARSGRDRFLVIPLTAVVEHHFHGSASGRNVPYARAEAGIGYFDYRLARGAGRVRARRGGAVGGAEVGLIFARWLRASARYRLFQEVDGVSFGGAELGVVVGALKLF